MGSSAKKKKEKKKDFQKTKFKVGKDKPKAANYTDTSFKAKSIVLTKQSLSVNAPSLAAQFSSHVSLLRSKSDSQRRDSLAFLTNVVSNRTDGEELPEPAAILIPKVQPLILDASQSVRIQLLKLFKCFTTDDVYPSTDQLLLYTRAGMTHLAADIRLFALEVLEWLLSVVSLEIVGCAGGWMKTLQCFMGLLGWEQSKTSVAWSSATGSVGKGSDSKVLSKQLGALAAFVRAGLALPPQQTSSESSDFPYSHQRQHRLPQRTNAFARLNLFGAPRDKENGMYEDREDRQRIFVGHFQAQIERGIADLKKEGGEVGRAATGLSRAMDQGLSDYEE